MNTLPTGARALLIALNTPGPNGTMGIPVLLWGRAGVGKSSFLLALDSELLKVITIIAAIHDPTDFSGLPIQQDGTVHYAAPAWVDEFAAYPDGILFLDELSTSPPSVQAALLRVVFERRVGFKPLPDRVRIVAAANPPDLIVGGWELSPPLRNRFVHLQWDITPELYIEALSDGWARGELPRIDATRHVAALPEVRLRIAGFLKIQPDALHGDPSTDAYGYASPRSWEYAARLLASCEVLSIPPDEELLRGCLGEGTAIALLAYLTHLKQPDPRAVLDGQVDPEVAAMNDGELYILFKSLNRVLERTTDEQLTTRFDRYLVHTLAVSQSGRKDVIYQALRQVAVSGTLGKAAALNGMQATPLPELLPRIQQLFDDETLNTYINVVT